MTNWQRIKGIFSGLFIILLSVIMLVDSDYGLDIVWAVVGIVMFAMGFRSLLFYFKMAKHMVGGRRSLYRGVILFDLGLFTLLLKDVPVLYILLYLIGIHAFSGTVDVLNALQARKLDSPAWKGKLIYGIGNLAMATMCIVFGFFKGNTDVVVYIYAAGLCYSGIIRIVNSFRRHAIIYIQ